MGPSQRNAYGMPIRYDQSRCCAELASKQRLWQQLQDGLRPGDDYELPSIDEAARQLQEKRTEKASQGAGRKRPTKPVQPGLLPPSINVLINHKAGMLH